MIKLQVKKLLNVHGRTYVGVHLLAGTIRIGQIVSNPGGQSWIIQEEQLVSLAGQQSHSDRHLLKLEPISHVACPDAGDILIG